MVDSTSYNSMQEAEDRALIKKKKKKKTASFQCSVSGNPEPAVVWSKMNRNQSQISHSAVPRRNLLLKSVKGSDSGEYRCSVANILGQAHAVAILVLNGELFF